MKLSFSISSVLDVFKDEIVTTINLSKWLPLFTSLAVLAPQIGPVPHISYIHIPLIALCLFKNLGRHWNVTWACVVFLFYLPLNIIIANPDPVFQSWPRLFLFVFVFALASPLFKGEYIAYLRRGLLSGVLFISSIISVGSFFCYFIGINYMKFGGKERGIDVYKGSSGSFGGLAVHSMVLALFAGISALYLYYRSTTQKEEKKIIYWALIILSILSVFFSASRSALLATFAGLLVMLYFIKKKNGSFIKTLLVIIVGAMLSFPLWEGAAEGVLKKQENTEKSGEKYGSRTVKWGARLDEFLSSPVFGVGFSAQDPDGKDEYDKRTGTVEPGSSWLCILSMTGAIGFILVVLMILRPVLFLRGDPNPYNALLLGLLTFFFLSFVSEGYVYAGGYAMCFVAWLVFGCANDVKEGYTIEEYSEEDENE